MAFALEHFPTFPYPPGGMQEVEEVERYLTSLHRSMQEFFSLLPRDIKDGISVVDLDDLANTTLPDPNADRIVFWDDGAGVYTWLTANTGLAISTTNLNLSHLGLEALTDPGADRIFFWDDGETASKWLAPNDFLTISGTNLNVDYVDEDDMVSNSATLLPTQQSVKAYVDNSIHSIIEQYLTDTADDDVVTYLVMDNVETGQGESTVVLEDMGTGDDQLIEEWVTPLGGLGAHTLVTGVYDLHMHAERTDGGRTVQLYWELWTRTSGGAETKRGTSEVTSAVTSKESFDPHVVIGTDVDINTTDRIVVKLYANVSSTPANDTDVTIYMEGSVESHLRMPTPFSTISNIFVRHDLATAANDFLVASGSGVYVKKTLAETGAILEGDLQHDNLQGITANEHIDWTGASDNFSTSGTLESGKLTVDAGGAQSIIIKGTSTGNANLGWIGFYDSNGTTRRGYVGDGSVQNDDIYIGADTGYLRLLAAGYINLGTHTYFPDDVVMSFGASLDYSIGYANATDTLQIVDGTTLGSNVRLKLDSSGHFDFGAGNLTTTGTLGCGVLTSGNIIIPDAGNIGSVSDTDAIAIAAGGEVTLSQTLILSDVVNAATDTDKFLVLDGSSNVDFRTGANVLADIGGAAASHAMATHSDEDTYNISTSGTLGAGNATLGTIGCGTITTTGNLVLPANGVVGVTDGNPQIVFDNANNRLEITGDVGIGIAVPVGELHVRKDQNAGTKLKVDNQANDTGAFCQASIIALGHSLHCYALGSGWTPSGRFVASGSMIEATGSGGLSFSAIHASGDINFWTASTNRMIIDQAGHLSVYDWDDSVLREVDFGADDSGGSGYKVLRIPN